MSFFLFPQLISAILEAAINKLATLDSTFVERCQPLVGKRLMIDLKELKGAIVLVGTGPQVTVMSGGQDQGADCTIRTSLAALKSLKDPNQITKLIKQDQLELDGDIQLAQQISELVKNTHIDWEEHLSYYIGDGLAHKVSSRFKSLSRSLAIKEQDLSHILTGLAQDELKVSPHPSQLKIFSDKVGQTRVRVDKLAAKVAKIAARKN